MIKWENKLGKKEFSTSLAGFQYPISNVQYRSLNGFRDVDRLNHHDYEAFYEWSRFETSSFDVLLCLTTNYQQRTKKQVEVWPDLKETFPYELYY